MLIPLPEFSIARLPAIHFGSGSFRQLPTRIAEHGRRVLLVTGARSLLNSAHWADLHTALQDAGIDWWHRVVDGEPSPELVDDAVARLGASDIQVVVGIGGGSVLDAAKAIAGLLWVGDSVMDYLEGVGAGRTYRGPAVPMIAVPTTAGTGSEATKNAVLSCQGAEGFKKSFRDEQLVPVETLIDPDLLVSCPARQIAANAMDALTQLLESYTSSRANPLTEALAESGLRAVGEGLFPWYEDNLPAGRERLAYAALLSGICLAQTGLGAVHGLASPLGALFPIPHGVVCGTLVAATTRVNLTALRQRHPNSTVLDRYALTHALLAGLAPGEGSADGLVALLEDWTRRLALPNLGAFGVTRRDFPRIIAASRGSSMQTNPVVLEDRELAAILETRCP